MNESKIGRRTFLQGVSLTALGAAVKLDARISPPQIAVPHSSGTELPKLKAPPLSCDCHRHVYDPARFPPVQKAQSNARVAEYRLLQQRIGTTRNVVVTPSAYGTDNRCTLDAIAQFGPRARGVAVVHPTITDAELKSLDAGGVRGIRFSVNGNRALGNAAVTSIDMIEPLAKRVTALGWHVQIFMRGDQTIAAEQMLNHLPTPVVFDHFGLLLPSGVNNPAFTVIRRLIDKGRTWVKLSGAYIETTTGPSGDIYVSYTNTYAAATKLAEIFVKAAPERIVWGSDWPHTGFAITEKPNDAVLFDLLSQWAPNEATRHRILVENPEALYGFG